MRTFYLPVGGMVMSNESSEHPSTICFNIFLPSVPWSSNYVLPPGFCTKILINFSNVSIFLFRKTQFWSQKSHFFGLQFLASFLFIIQFSLSWLEAALEAMLLCIRNFVSVIYFLKWPAMIPCSILNLCSFILSHVWVTIDGVWFGNCIYWPLIGRSYK
jgi:hypothetical protein